MIWTRDIGGGVVELLAPTRRMDLPSGVDASFVASTGAEARDGDIIDQDSWLLDDYRANPVILDNHSMDAVVGRSVRVAVEDVGLVADVQWDAADVNPRGQLVAHQHAAGFRAAVSVRWLTGRAIKRNELPKDDPLYSEGKVISTPWGDMPQVGRVMYDNTLLEISSVSVPADPRAIQLRGLAPEIIARLGDRDAATGHEIEDLMVARAAADSEQLQATVRAAVLSLVRSDPELRTAIRALGLTDHSPTLAVDPVAALLGL